MRSHLTRNVYRRLLAGHGLVRPCPGQLVFFSSSSSSRRLSRPPSQLLIRHAPRRTFFGIFKKPPRELKEPELEPGYDVLLKFRSDETENERLQSQAALLKGLREFLEHKKRYHKFLNSTQAFLTSRLVRHLLETEAPPEELSKDLDVVDLRLALELALKRPRGDCANHLALAKVLYAGIEQRTGAGAIEADGADPESALEVSSPEERHQDFQQYLTALVQYGASLEAVECLAEHLKELQAKGETNKGARVLWVLVLEGLASEGREEELLREYRNAEAAGVNYMPPVHEVMTTFFARRDRVPETKHWFGKPIHGNWSPTTEAYMEVVRFAVRNNQKDWIRPVFEKLVKSNPQKSRWDVIFAWAVLAMDKGVEDIKQMMELMMKSPKNSSNHKKEKRPDADTINVLIKAAIEKKNPYLAERFLALATELGIQQNYATYILQMDYRLEAGDLSGVQAIYQKLRSREVAVWYEADVPVLNKYLRALCAAETPDIERILDITSELERRYIIIEPETTVSLCTLFLRSDKQFDVIDTLSLHTLSYSIEERRQVQHGFVQYCLDRKVSTARAWDAYSLLRQYFPDTSKEDRIRLMDELFARKRPDMACHVFGHMRAHAAMDMRPTRETYVRCLEGIGRYPDLESLRVVHNMLKMDTTIQLDTQLYNALMVAYTSCDEVLLALDLWEQITNMPEGPSYNSLAIVFWACEKMYWFYFNADRRIARDIWEKVQRLDLDVPPAVFNSYVGAVAAEGALENIKRLIQGMDATMGYSPSVITFGIAFNALPAEELKTRFKQWATTEYPELWARLETKGCKQTLRGTMYNVERNFEA
ncbi:complex I intermediate-associated protein 84, mitochondrial [Rhypophila decipiens]